jgi:poly(3-hydroxybutyrate) depolymerase
VRTRTTVAALLLLAALGLAAEPGPAEREGLAKVQAVWLDLARFCVEKKLGLGARACVERAREAGPVPDALAKEAADCPETGRDGDRERLAKRHLQAAKQAAGLWDKLAQVAAKDGAPERVAVYRGRAVEAEPSARRFAALVDALEARASADPAGVAEVASRALARGADEAVKARLVALGDGAAVGKPVLRAARGHAMRYWLSLPQGFRRKQGAPWPVLVAVDGAGCNFEGIAGAYAGQRGAWPFVVVAPVTFGNTNAIDGPLRERYVATYGEATVQAALASRLEWDEAGLVAVLDELADELGTSPKACMTGFSGGGLLTYRMILRRPDRLAAAAPACANFHGGVGVPLPAEATPEAKALQVSILTGADDPHRDFTFGNKAMPGIEPQTDAAVELLQRRGYESVMRRMLPGVGHDPAPRHVLDALSPFLSVRKG